MTLSHFRKWICFITDEFYNINTVIFLFVTVKLLWNNLYCIKRYINKYDLQHQNSRYKSLWSGKEVSGGSSMSQTLLLQKNKANAAFHDMTPLKMMCLTSLTYVLDVDVILGAGLKQSDAHLLSKLLRVIGLHHFRGGIVILITHWTQSRGNER